MNNVKREKMPVSERAKQFGAFAALRGYEKMVKEKESTPCEKEELSEERAENLSAVMRGLKKGDLVKVRYYDGERYVTTSGKLTEKNEACGYIKVVKTRVAFGDVAELTKEEEEI